MNTPILRRLGLAAALTTPLLLVGCGGGSSNTDADVSYQIRIQNLSVGQPLSPPAVIAHGSGYQLFSIGQPASEPLEQLAEGGSPAALATAAAADQAVFAVTSGTAPIAPGASQTLTLVVKQSQVASLEFSIATMLVNTNDAFTGINGSNLSGLASGQSSTFNTASYDSGTEANSETAASIPGPAGGGEGFNAARDDLADRVTMHSGVVTQDDGLATSALTQQHRWDDPISRITITRQ